MNVVDLSNLNESYLDKNIELYGSVMSVRPGGKKLSFLILYDSFYSLQCVCLKSTLKDQFDLINTLTQNSKVLLSGVLKSLPSEQPLIKSCYYQTFEFIVDNIIIDGFAEPLPFCMEDANIPYNDETERSRVLLPTRLDNRTIDLHTPFNNALFECKSAMVNGYRNAMLSKGFVEIQTPKILGVSSESGSSVFKLDYFGKQAFLAQSPQLYKQMMINSGFRGVFEVAPVFRSENSFTNRHLCEFIGFDFETRINPKQSYHQIVNVVWSALKTMFNYLTDEFSINQHTRNAVEYIRSVHNFTNEGAIQPLLPLLRILRDVNHFVCLQRV